MMQYELAPMEGVTTYCFRRVYEQFFTPLDKYVTPFLSPSQHTLLNYREMQEVLPEHNGNQNLVPQILGKDPTLVVELARELEQMGYHEINLNLGCPSATVVTKGKGAGALRDLPALNSYLDQIFQGVPQMKISIKTRLGINDENEFWEIIKIYEKFPVHELIIHPRVQQDFYKKELHMETFEKVLSLTKLPVTYNGDLFTVDRIRQFEKSYPQVQTVMIGRGIAADPSMVDYLKTGNCLEKKRLYDFCQLLLEEYVAISSGEKNALFKMKELWFYLAPLFTNPERYLKRIRKANRVKEYQCAVNELFYEQELKLRY